MKVAIVGYGKMGHQIEELLLERGHGVSLIIDRDNAAELDAVHLSGVDVAIEFSAPAAAFDNIMQCLRCGVPVVCGTTAWLDRFEEVKGYCEGRSGRFFYASNFSVGVNLFFRISRQMAAMMNNFAQYDVTLREVHHTQKLDAPSGTAVTLADGVLGELDRKSSWVLGHTTDAEVVGVAAERRADVVGDHEVVWESAQDVISLEHRAKNRVGFAMGAILAAEFLVERVNVGEFGVYTMDDLLDRYEK